MIKTFTFYQWMNSDTYNLFIYITDPKIHNAHGLRFEINSQEHVDYLYTLNCNEKGNKEVSLPNIPKKELHRAIRIIFNLKLF